jgi:hypothetical protein
MMADAGKFFSLFILGFKEKSNSKFTKEEKQWLITNFYNPTLPPP